MVLHLAIGRVGNCHFFFKQGLSYKLRPCFVIVGIFIQLFGGWKAKLYDCPSSKRDEQRSALRRELTDIYSKRLFSLLFLLFSFYFLLFHLFPLPRHRLRRCHSLSGEGDLICFVLCYLLSVLYLLFLSINFVIRILIANFALFLEILFRE